MITEYLKKQAVRYHANQGITVSPVTDAESGYTMVKNLLYEVVDKKTTLYLSGGSIQRLYEQLSKEETISPGAVGMVDERFGLPLHATSNEKMIKDTGLLRYFSFRDIPFYPMIKPGKTREESAALYDQKVRELQSTFQMHIGLIGIGPDGHISSIIPNREDFHNPWFDVDRQHLLVSEFNDPTSHYKERVGMTFLGLSMLDVLLVLAFGDSKQPMFELLFADGSEEEIPARFFKRPEIAAKTLLITDQQV